jgi:hypothetical protein
MKYMFTSQYKNTLFDNIFSLNTSSKHMYFDFTKENGEFGKLS